MSVVRARRPVATSTSSPRSSPSSVVSTTSPPSRRAAVTPVPSRTSTPASRRDAATASQAAGSSGASSRSPCSTIVTCDPSARHAVASSHPTTPPPTISSRPGASFALVASRGVQGSMSRSPSIGGTAADEPVHTATACRAVSRGLGAVGVGDHDRPLAVEPAGAAEQVDAGSVHPLDLRGVVPVGGEPVAAGERRGDVLVAGHRLRRTVDARASPSTSVPRSSALLGMHAQ